jgi:hypothetical protein
VGGVQIGVLKSPPEPIIIPPPSITATNDRTSPAVAARCLNALLERLWWLGLFSNLKESTFFEERWG